MNIYQVDAFTKVVFKGNPAAVCPLDYWIETDLMQSIAAENNLSETVFFVKNKALFEIRWFTPEWEIDLCGHATLAAAHIIFTEFHYSEKEIKFSSKSGELTVSKAEKGYTLNFPSEEITEINTPKLLSAALNVPVLKTYKGTWKLLVLLENETMVKNVKPDFNALSRLEYKGICITAKGDKVDFVSRFFAPKIGINEDPVTGSAHTLLIPYWANELKKNKMDAKQISKRGGDLKCEYLKNRVEMSGEAITYLKGKINV